jgi:hypothetical protein
VGEAEHKGGYRESPGGSSIPVEPVCHRWMPRSVRGEQYVEWSGYSTARRRRGSVRLVVDSAAAITREGCYHGQPLTSPDSPRHSLLLFIVVSKASEAAAASEVVGMSGRVACQLSGARTIPAEQTYTGTGTCTVQMYE